MTSGTQDEKIIRGVEIYSADSFGRGVGRHDGKVVFVKAAAPGDVIDCRVIQPAEKFDVAEIVEITRPSSERVEPVCPHYTVCPGCAYQHIEYDLELKLKGVRISDSLRKIGKVDVGEVAVTGSPEQYGYRSHVTLQLWYNGFDLSVGFIDSAAGRVVSISECHLFPGFARDISGIISRECTEFIGKFQGKFKLKLPFIMRRDDERAMLVKGRYREKGSGRMKTEVFDFLSGLFPVVGGTVRTIMGSRFQFSPLSFTQANEFLLPVLYEKAAAAATKGKKGELLDLYSGVGVLGILASQGMPVTFMEESESSIADLNENIELNRIDNTAIIKGDLDRILKGVIRSKPGLERVIVNPPRKGMAKNVTALIGESGIGRMVYVSCNPATLGRDVLRLSEYGFRLDSIEGVDMFPRTPHVECIATLIRENVT